MSRLRDVFRQGPHRGQFYAVVEMTDALSRLAVRRGLTVSETCDAVLLSLVSLVQAAAPVTEWDTVGQQIADEVRRRLAIRDDSGPEDYRRRAV